MRWLFRFVLFFLMLPLAYLLATPQLLRCLWAPYDADLQQISSGVFVSKDTPPHHRAYLKRAYQQARNRVASFWGGQTQSKALLIYCPSPEQYAAYCQGGEGAGCSLGTPWGDAWIVVNPHGRNVDVLAHELCHDELYTRLGWLRAQRQVPQWFNEGLALMLDGRFTQARDSLQRYVDYRDEWEYLTRGQQIVFELDDLASMRDFFGGSAGHVRLAYATAGMEVARWLALVGRRGIPQLVAHLRQGEDFDAVYRRLEQEARRRQSSPQRKG